MLSIDDVYFRYDEKPVLNKLSFDAEPGNIYGILGPNGSGKTTLMNILAGRLSPDEGTVRWDRKPLTHQHIAYLESEPYFYPMITGREYLTLFNRQNPDFNLQRWNELFELPLDQLIETYSSGMKKKLAFMGVICFDRPVLLLDEPFNNLDIEANQLISKILELLKQKRKIILLTSHAIEILTSMTNFIHLLKEGRIRETIPKRQFHSWQKTYRRNELDAQINKVKDLL